MTMSLQEILKNVYSFLKILEIARSSEVRHWNHDSLNKAVSWAIWCEKLAVQVERKKYADEFDSQIRQLGYSYGSTDITTATLTRATSLLNLYLLGNSHLPNHLILTLLDDALPSPYQRSHFIQVCAETIHKKACVELIHSSLGTTRLTDSTLQSCATHLVKFLHSNATAASSVSKSLLLGLEDRDIRSIVENSTDILSVLFDWLEAEASHFIPSLQDSRMVWISQDTISYSDLQDILKELLTMQPHVIRFVKQRLSKLDTHPLWHSLCHTLLKLQLL